MSRANVRITPDVTQKFVLVSGIANDGEEMVLLWGNPTAEWHKDIVQEIRNARFKNLKVMGGGKIKSQTDLKQVYVWDKSSRYGNVPAENVRLAIKEGLEDYSIVFGDPDK